MDNEAPDNFPYYKTYATQTPRQVFTELCTHEPVVFEVFNYRNLELASVPEHIVEAGRVWKHVSTTTWEELDCLSDFYTEYARMRARKSHQLGSPHAYQCMTKQPLGKTADERRAQREQIYHTFNEVGQFRVTWAKAVYTVLRSLLFDDEQEDSAATLHNMRVLDMCAGWGDRMLAALSMNAASFIGIDPNEQLRTGYTQIISEHGDAQNHRIVYAPIESMVVDNPSSVDIAFTSPPFFDLECYADNTTQVHVRYTTADEYWHHFFVPMLTFAHTRLKTRAVLAVHIVDTRRMQIVSRMHEYLCNTLAMKYVGVVALAAGNVRWPVWIYRKLACVRSKPHE